MQRMVRSHWLTAAVILAASCQPKEETKEQDPALVRKEIPPTEVRTIPVQRTSFNYLIHTNGRIQASTDVTVLSRAVGLADEVLVHNGSFVKQGDLLIRLNSTRQKLALEEAEVRMRERELTFRDQLLSYAGSDTLRYAQAMQNLRISSGLAAAEVAWRQARQEYENLFIRATVSGIISNLKVKPGSLVREQDELCRIHDPASITAVCEVLEEDALKLRRGMQAEVTGWNDGQQAKGVISEINPRVDEKSKLVGVTVQLQTSRSWLPGMHVQATLAVPYEAVLLVPKEAVVIRSGRHVVFTEENGLAKWKYVEVGLENGKEIIIVNGLNEQDKAIITNNLQLAHDAPVQVVNQ